MTTILPFLLISIFALEPSPHQLMFTNIPSERKLGYAEELFNGEIYNAAILEYKRFLFYHPGTDLTDFAHYRIAQSQYYQSNLADAQRLFQEFMRTDSESPLYPYAKLMFGKTHFDNQEYAKARSVFFELLRTNANKSLLEQAQYLRSWCYIHDGDWFNAISEFRKVGLINEVNPSDKLLTHGFGHVATQLANITLANTPLPRKSPKLAQLLSTIIPGSGQIYAGKISNGIISTAINTVFLYLLRNSLINKRYVDSVGIYLIGSRFYWGNRSNARKWAIEHNRDVESRFIQNLKELERSTTR